MTHAPNLIGSLVVAGFVALAFSAAPIGLGDNYAPEIKSAFAKGGGNGGGAGASGDHGGGNSGNQGGGQANSNSDFGHGQANSNSGNGSTNSHRQQGEKASALGNLNAAHASPTALANANPDSMVGLIAAYAAAAESMSAADAQEALGAISNKSDELGLVDAAVVAEVNALLGDLENNGVE